MRFFLFYKLLHTHRNYNEIHFHLKKLKKKPFHSDYLLGFKRIVFQQSITITHSMIHTFVLYVYKMQLQYALDARPTHVHFNYADVYVRKWRIVQAFIRTATHHQTSTALKSNITPNLCTTIVYKPRSTTLGGVTKNTKQSIAKTNTIL